MAGTKAIRKKIGNVEDQIRKQVRSLEKDLAVLGKKLGKKEVEIRRLKEKITSDFVRDVRKKVKSAKKTVKKARKNVTKRLSKIL